MTVQIGSTTKVTDIVELRQLRGPVIKRCACGAAFTQRQWNALKLVGYHSDDVEELELRNCGCGSTIAITLGSVFQKPALRLVGM